MNEIKEWRKSHGYTQKRLAELLGMPKRTLEDYEAERRVPPPWVAKLIMDKLNSIKD